MHVSTKNMAWHAHPVLRSWRSCRAYDASVFETTIRVLGGMLTAYELSSDRIFLTRCASLGSTTHDRVPHITQEHTMRRYSAHCALVSRHCLYVAVATRTLASVGLTDV